MEQETHITLRFDLASGKINLNEIVYKLKHLRDPLMVQILEQIIQGYDDLICDRLSEAHSTAERKGLGRHIRRAYPEKGFCRGHKARKRGYRNYRRQFSTIFGKANIPLRVVECCQCGARYSPLLGALKIGRYDRRETNF